VRVHRRPRVAIVCTGDELRALGDAAGGAAFTLVNSNAPMLQAQAEEAGAEVVRVAQAADRLEAISAQLQQAIASADLVLTSGGVSVGDHDLVGKALPHAGVEALFWKVAMKPGKPLLFGVAGRVPVIGLPGNPVSAFVGFEVFVRPALARMRGLALPFPRLVSLPLAHDYARSKGRPELLRARFVERAGELHGELHARQGSGSLPSIAAVDALVFVPAEVTQLAAGSLVSALRIAAPPECATAPFP
jgi:molybdopterin molybdotransferase